MTHATGRVLLTLVTLHAATLALAADGAGSAIARCAALRAQDTSVAHTATWICRIAGMVRDLNLYSWVDGITWAVLLAFFVGRTLSISLDPAAGSKLRVFLTASMIGFGVMLMLTPIRSAMFNVWQYSYTFSQTHGASAVVSALEHAVQDLDSSEAATALAAAQIGKNLIGVPAAGAVTMGGAAAVTQGVSRLKTVAQGAKDLVKRLPIGRIIDAVLLPIMALYSITIYGSALAIIIGTLVLPIGAVMVLAGSGSRFFSTWSNVMLGGVLTMVIFPLMWGVAVDVAVVEPLLNFIQHLDGILTQYEATVDAIKSRQVAWYDVAAQFEGLVALGMAAGNLITSILGMFVQVIVGAVTAFALVFLLQQIIARFIGGVVSGAARGTIVGAALGMLGGSSKKGSGKGSDDQAQGAEGSDGEPPTRTTRPRGSDDGSSRAGSAAASSASGAGPARPIEPMIPASPGRVGRATVTPASDAAAPPPTGASPGRIGQAAINPADPGNAPPPSVARPGHIGQATVTYRGPAQTRDDFPDDFDAAPPRRRR